MSHGEYADETDRQTVTLHFLLDVVSIIKEKQDLPQSRWVNMKLLETMES